MASQKTVTETERLIFLTWDEENPELLVELCKNTGVREFASSTYRNMTETSAREFILKQNAMFADNHTGKFAVYFKAQNELIGVSGIFESDISGKYEINYRFKRDYWGMGLGMEAAKAMISYGFEKLDLNEVYASVAHDNVRSRNLLSKIGMLFERKSPFDSDEEIWMIAKEK